MSLKDENCSKDQSVRFSIPELGKDDESLSTSFQAFCQKLDVNLKLVEDAWIDFERVTGKYALEGNMSSWYVVALYTTWKASPSSYTGLQLELPKVLGEAKLVMPEFLQKAHKWMIMTNAQSTLSTHINRLLTCFSVTSRLFALYCDKYCAIFLVPELIVSIDTSINKRKQRKRQCSRMELFYFVWLLFITAKASTPEFEDASISLLQLLLCCLQHIYASVFTNNNLRLKLLNNEHSVLFKSSSETVTEKHVPQLLPILFPNESDKFMDDFNTIQNNQWKAFLLSMINCGTLKTEPGKISNFLEPDIFAHNLNRLDTTYKELVCANDLLDERQFLFSLYDDAPFNSFTSPHLKEYFDRHKPLNTLCNSDSSPSISHNTPKKIPSVPSKSDIFKTLAPISLSHFSFLNAISYILEKDTFDQQLHNDLLHTIHERLKSSQWPESIVLNFDMCTAIYHKLLISIIQYEKRRDPASDITSLINNTDFHLSLICSALEVLVFALKEKFEFPWSLEIVGIDAFVFFRIVELIIRAENNLTRETVRHFNALEEKIVSYHAWVSGSSLYLALEKNGNKMPRLEEVSFSYFIETSAITPKQETLSTTKSTDDLPANTSASVFPNIAPRICTPLFSATNFFGDETRRKKLSMATRNLFSAQKAESSLDKTPVVVSSCSGSHNGPIIVNTNTTDVKFLKVVSLVDQYDGLNTTLSRSSSNPHMINSSSMSASHIPYSTNCKVSSCGSYHTPGDGSVAACIACDRSDSLDKAINQESLSTLPPPTPSSCCVTPPKTTRLSPLIFFARKVYYVSSTRLHSLCDFLKATEVTKAKCWTCFQHILLEYFDLFEDHYLDQLIMCSAYAVGRSTNLNWSFNEIIRWYRTQEYYETKAYRKALIPKTKKSENTKNSSSNSKIPRNNGSLHDNSHNAEYGDLITYYNEIFLRRVNSFISRFIPTKEAEASLELSPFPLIRGIKNFQPHKISQDVSVYISPNKSASNTPKKFTPLYCFENSPLTVGHATACESPSGALSSHGSKRKAPNMEDINSMICCATPIKLSKLEI